MSKMNPTKRRKGTSLLQFPNDYTVIDIETTGLSPNYDSIIEISCIKYRNNIEVDFFSSLVQPPPFHVAKSEQDKLDNANYHGLVAYVNCFISCFTGITSEMLSGAPKFEDIADALWNFLHNEILVGHNIHFDLNFLYDNLFAHNQSYILNNDFVDTMRIARLALPDLEHHRLIDLDDYFDIQSQHHRAESDCQTTTIVLQELAKLVTNNAINLTPHKPVDLRTLTASQSSFDIGHPLYNKHCVFTGKLERFIRKDAAQIVVNLGGYCENNINKRTNFLIVGDFDYVSNIKDGKSTKLKKAEQLILKGQDLQIIPENDFYNMIENI